MIPSEMLLAPPKLLAIVAVEVLERNTEANCLTGRRPSPLRLLVALLAEIRAASREFGAQTVRRRRFSESSRDEESNQPLTLFKPSTKLCRLGSTSGAFQR